MLYYSDDSFDHPQISNFELGTDMFVGVSWSDKLKPLQPTFDRVRFYVDSCAIKVMAATY